MRIHRGKYERAERCTEAELPVDFLLGIAQCICEETIRGGRKNDLKEKREQSLEPIQGQEEFVFAPDKKGKAVNSWALSKVLRRVLSQEWSKISSR